MDPPWKYGGSGGSKWLRADNFYETISDKELLIKLEKSIKPLIDEKSCLIFVWVTSPHLEKSIALICKSLSVNYITVGFVWYKERANVGNYTMSSCEYCLIFKKGKIPSDRIRNPGTMQFLSKPVSKHSEIAIVVSGLRLCGSLVITVTVVPDDVILSIVISGSRIVPVLI